MAIPQEVYIQMGIYVGIFVLTVIILSLLLRGFLWKYIAVKMSRGAKFLVKIRTPLRDYFEVGWMKDGVIEHKQYGKKIEVSIPESFNPFYRCLGVNWVDKDEETNGFVKPDFSAILGYDANKLENLHERALTQPQLNSTNEKLIFVLLIVAIIASVAAAYLAFKSYDATHILSVNIPEWLKNIKMTVTGGGV